MKYFETHAHYDDERFNEDREEELATLKENDIDLVVNIGADMESSKNSIELSKKYDFIYATVGVHPHEAQNMTMEDLTELEEMSKDDKVVAIGEIGLDYYYDNSDREKQVYWFKKQLELAKKLDLPVVIHSRDADQQCFDIIKASGYGKGVIHCFSGSAEMAAEYIKLGYLIGVGGVVTFKNGKKLQNVVKKIGIEHIVLETDLPYLSPEPHRGTRNSAKNLTYIADKISEILEIPKSQVVSNAYFNGEKLYSIEK